MSLLLVNCDLRAPGRNYDDVYSQLKSYDNWWHHIESVWIVTTDKTPEEVRDDIAARADRNDKILGVDISNQPAAWPGIEQSGSTWLKNSDG
jgi:hypothetical protein